MSDIPNTFNSGYYDNKYFADKAGKTFLRSDGSIDRWGYRNPEGEWTGCGPIINAWKFIFNPKNMLDVGCGRGTFITYARDIGIEAEGFDFSEWAIKNPYYRCKKEWLMIHDATNPWPYKDNHFDLVVVLDFLEHLYIDDIDAVISEIYRVAKKWIFFQIAIGNEYVCYNLKKGQDIPANLEANIVAGHVTVQLESFWCEKLAKNGWRFRKDIVDIFSKIVSHDIIKNWLLSSMIIMEKYEI